jgi:hypothetical protein
MPLTRHVERHFTSGDTVRDIVIGMSDGLTVPFALAAGLSGAVQSTSIVITAGLAEICRGVDRYRPRRISRRTERCRTLRQRAAPRTDRSPRHPRGGSQGSDRCARILRR